MTKTNPKEANFNPEEELRINYLANRDFTGERVILNDQELVEYRNKSMHRIWLNDLTQTFLPHWHSAMEIIIPIDNYYDVTVGTESYHLVPDNILFIPPREIHSIDEAPKGTRFIYIMNINSITTLRNFSGLQPILSQPLLLTRETHPRIYDDIYSLLIQIRSEYFNCNEFAELTIQAHLLNMFVKLGENRNVENELFSGMRPIKQQKYIESLNSALEYINENYTEEISLDNLAKHIGFSKYHFSRLFKQYTDYNFSDYLCMRRMKAAEEMLEDASISIMEVALNSGFASISTFNRIFKQKKGITPSEYRRKMTIQQTNYS